MEDRGVEIEVLLDIFRLAKRRIEGLDNGFDRAMLSAITAVCSPQANRITIQY